MNKPVIILGAGGHAKVLIDCLRLNNAEIIGILDNDKSKAGSRLSDIPVIGTDGDIEKYPGNEVQLVNGLGSIKSTHRRKDLFDFFKNKGYVFASVIHPSAVIARDAVWGEGAQIMAGSVIQPGCRLGDNVLVNTRASVDHDCFIGSNAHIAPGAVLSGNVSVGEGTHLGTGAIVIQGVNIGKNCVIGAGALVLKDVYDQSFMAGSPAKNK